MLEIKIGSEEFWDEDKEEFVYTEGETYLFEHSLVSISKWESEHCTPFFKVERHSSDEIISYIKHMCLSHQLTDDDVKNFTIDTINSITKYIDKKQSATTFSETKGGRKEVITSELIYYWMTAHNIPFECENWPLQRLLNLIQICGIKSNPKGGKKLSRAEIANRNRSLNAQRKAKYGTSG